MKRPALRRIALGGACAVVLVLASAPAVAWADITVTEGQSFSGQLVATGGCGQAPGSATVDWGDGTTSPGTRTPDGMGVQGTHTYAEERSFNGIVTYDCPQQSDFPLTAPFRATVRDAALTGAGQDSAGGAQQSLSAVVAHVADANPAADANDLSALIGWGDGTSSAGAVSPAAGGGFDVAGTHTYSTAGSYRVSTSITDLGGATVTVSSTAQITVGAPPPPPPPPLVGPQAQFGQSPSLSCADDAVTFDASASKGGTASVSVGGLPVTLRRPITRYRWSIYDPTSVMGGNPPVQPVVTTTPRFTHVFGPAYSVIGGYRGMYDTGPFSFPSPEQGAGTVFPGWDLRIFRPGVTVALQVTDSTGQSASTNRYFTFRNPDDTVVMLFLETSYTPVYKTYEYYTPGHDANGQEVWSSDPNKNIKHEGSYQDWAHPKGSGVTDFTKPLGTVQQYGYGKGCDSRTVLQKAGVATLKEKPATLRTQRALLHVDPTDATVEVQHPCVYAGLGCDGILEVDTVRSARRPGDLIRLAKPGPVAVGLTRFVVPAGRRNAIATINLNAVGYALARAHELRRVTLRLVSGGTNGRLALTSRTVRLRTRR